MRITEKPLIFIRLMSYQRAARGATSELLAQRAVSSTKGEASGRYVDGHGVDFQQWIMAKVMLVIDDFNELLYIETLLKRMGFDVFSLNKDATLADSLLGFFPAMVVSTFKGPLVDGIRVSALVKKQVPNAKVALLYPQSTMPQMTSEQKGKVDALIEMPVQPQDTLLIIAQLLKLDAQALLEKFEKISKARSLSRGEEDVLILRSESVEGAAPLGAPGSANTGFAGGQGRPSGDPKTERERRYDAFLAKVSDEPVDKVLPRERMAQAEKELAEASKGDADELARIDEQKREFVRAMLKKARKDE